MRVLVLGGTQFIGRHIVETLLEGGHSVSILTRGRTPDELPAEVERLRGDRDQGLAGIEALTGRSWDVCVDVCGYTPRQVRPSAEKLRPCINCYLYISAIMTYGDTQNRPVLETHPQVAPVSEDVTEINGETYGPLKVTCEQIVREIYGDQCTIFRPQTVVGPYDISGRYAYWVQRAQSGGEMMAPGDGTDHLQVIDVRDLARFARTVIENDISGDFNLAGPRITWAEFITILGAKNVVWVSADILMASGLTFVELPIYRPEHGLHSGLMDVNTEKARRAGLTLRSPEETYRDMRAWLADKEPARPLSPEQEAALIRAARQR